MFKSKSLNLNGLKVSADKPITPRTRTFLIQHNMHVTQSDGFVTLTGDFSISKNEVDVFLKEKAEQDAQKIKKPAEQKSKPASNPSDNSKNKKDNDDDFGSGFKRGFLLKPR